MRNNLVETIMGAVVLIITGGFLYFAFSNANVGGEVKISGINVGTIISQYLDIDTYEAVVEISIDESIKLPEDTFAKITSEGLLGGNYLVLDPGGSDIMLESGDQIIETQGAVDLLGLLSAFASGSDE